MSAQLRRRRPWRLAILAAALLVAGRAGAENGCVTAACHATLLSKKGVHAPTDSCDTCHEAAATPHPQKGKATLAARWTGFW